LPRPRAWFERWFDEHYLALYPHRDDAEAERLVALVAARTRLARDARVLDLCCGGGRHLAAFARRLDRAPVGLDLSPALLAAAHRRLGDTAALVRADVRALPLAPGSLDLVTSLFTSFGYFDTDAEHLAMLAAVARALRPGGWFTLDFLNAARVRDTLVARDERRVRGHHVVQERALERGGRYVVKRIRVCRGDDGPPLTAEERVRLYTPDDLADLLARAGLRVQEACGDYDGGPLTGAAPRCVLFARRAAPGH